MSRPRVALLALLVLLTSACTGATDRRPTGAGSPSADGPLDVTAVWTGREQDSFRAVLAAFTEQSGIPTRYAPTGPDVAADLDVREQEGSSPDVAVLPQPGLLRSLAVRRLLVPLAPEAQDAVDAHQDPFWVTLGTAAGQRYGVTFKVANKSVWWYRPQALARAGVRPPTTLAQTLEAARRTAAGGAPFLAIGGADGWPLTDLFENLYLDGAGPTAYDQLGAHELPWTHPTVRRALTQLQSLTSAPGALAGGPEGVLALDFPASVAAALGPSPTAATVFEGDFVRDVVVGLHPAAEAGTDYDFFPFPTVGAAAPSVVAGADVAVAMTADPRAQRLLAFLATPEAAKVWARRGGFLSPVRDLPREAYPDDVTRRIVDLTQASLAAGRVRVDLSDLPPTSFGATAGAGLYLHLQELVAGTPVEQVAAALEAEASAAFRTF